jgi:hypothetical protein
VAVAAMSESLAQLQCGVTALCSEVMPAPVHSRRSLVRRSGR